MSLREWLIAIGTLVIIGIVIDGVRRVRRARKESMEISSGMGADELKESPLDEEFNPELPNGGARTISRDTLEERGYVKREKSSRFGTPKPKPTRPVTADTGKARPDPDTSFEPRDDSPETDSEYGFSSHEPFETERDSGWGQPRMISSRMTASWGSQECFARSSSTPNRAPLQMHRPLELAPPKRCRRPLPRKWKKTPPDANHPSPEAGNLWQGSIARRPAKWWSSMCWPVTEKNSRGRP